MNRPFFRSCEWPLFVLFLICFASAILGDSTAESLLLARYGSRYVPVLFLVNATLLFVFSTIIMAIIDRTERGKLFVGFLLCHAAIIAGVRFMAELEVKFLFLALFSYAYLTKILLFLMFWTLANDLIDSHRAGAKFPFIAAGGTLGAICISFAIPSLLRLISPVNLLLVWMVASLLACLFFLPIWQSFGVCFRPVGNGYRRSVLRISTIAVDLKVVRTDPLLKSMALLYFLLFFIMLNQHYDFYSQLQIRFKESVMPAKDIARFLGFFNGISMITTFAFQSTIAGPIIKTLGSTRSMFILPASLLVVFTMLTVSHIISSGSSSAISLIFWAVVVGMGTRIAFFDSFFSPNFQVFFSSLPKNIRGKGKLSMEGIVKPCAMMCASFWLSSVAPRFPPFLNMCILACISAAMIVQTQRLKRRYTESLANYLRGFKSKNTQLIRTIESWSKETLFIDLLKDLLTKEESSVKTYVIDMLTLINSREATSLLLDQLHVAEPRVRATIISALGATSGRELKGVFFERLNDSDERVVSNCIEVLGGYRDPEVYEKVHPFLNHLNPRIRANTVVTLWPYARESERAELMLLLRHMLTMQLPEHAASALYAMGKIRYPSLVDELKKFYHDHAHRIRENRTVWRQFTLALGKSGHPGAIDLLLDMAAEPSRKRRAAICTSLSMLINRGIPISSLIVRISQANYMQRSVLLKTLYVRPFERKKDIIQILQNAARREVFEIYGHWLAYSALPSTIDIAEVALLRYAIVEECINESLRNLFYLASMLDASGQIRRIVHRLFHVDKHVRGQALEVLDNTGDFKTNRMIIQLLETTDPQIHAREAISQFHIKPKSYFAVLNEYAGNPNYWVRECAAIVTQKVLFSAKHFSPVHDSSQGNTAAAGRDDNQRKG